jgi:superfamily I DNA/RNA helicase
MKVEQLSKVVQRAKCKVIGWEEASNDGHRFTLAVLIQTFDNTESALLCEPSLARKTHRPPDIVLIDPEIGVHVFEVKGMTLDGIESIEAGGQLRIRYPNGIRNRSPIAQGRNAMFDIKDATVRALNDEVQFPFEYWVVFPLIMRQQWFNRFGPHAFCPDEFLFSDDLDSSHLHLLLGVTDRQDSTVPIKLCPLHQLDCVWRAFGDTSVLYAGPEEREHRKAAEGTLGEQFDEAAESYKNLSEEQQRLSAMDWQEGPRLVRGVAGSGKTVVLANNLARRLERMLIARTEDMFNARSAKPRLLAVCFNRTLAPFLEKKIRIAFEQRTGSPVPEGMIEVCSFNTLMFKLTTAGLWKYKSVQNAQEIVRALQYLGDLEEIRQRNPAKVAELAYDAIYVDEGQDFLEEEFRLLKELCRVKDGSEPNLYVFYDDTQNLYGRARPNWLSLGVNVRGGRSFVMTDCFRNTRQIVECTFNVLYGSCATGGEVPTKEYGDIRSLEQKSLIQKEDGFWRVKFAKREGMLPVLSPAANLRLENQLIVTRLRLLVEEQQVRIEDIQILTCTKRRVGELAEAIRIANIPGVDNIHVASIEEQKDQPLNRKGFLTVSTVASAKGYDAYCVLLASANEFVPDVKGRATFYVGCTRAIEYLEVFAYENKGLAAEMKAVLSRLSATAPKRLDESGSVA